MKNRIITIQVEITDPAKAQWIWDNHMGQDTQNGVYVETILEGKNLEIHAEMLRCLHRENKDFFNEENKEIILDFISNFFNKWDGQTTNL